MFMVPYHKFSFETSLNFNHLLVRARNNNCSQQTAAPRHDSDVRRTLTIKKCKLMILSRNINYYQKADLINNLEMLIKVLN